MTHRKKCILQQYSSIFYYFNFESAKLRALRAKNVLTRQRPLRVYVLTCQRNLHTYVLTCVRALHAYVLTCQRALRAHVTTCQCALREYMLICKRAILNTVNSYTIQICYLYLGLNRENIGETYAR